jgi:putative spermidine/putrescine transport system substrate-binding protein
MLTRREMMMRSAAAGASALAFPGFARDTKPATKASRGFTLRVLGTHVTLQEQIRLAAEADLGFNIEFTPGGSASVLQQASTRPESFDVYEQWSNSINILWRSGAIQPVQTDRINLWSSINPISKTGRLSEGDRIGAGDVPNTLLYVQPGKTLGSQPAEQVSYLPYVHNVDSFGYDTRHIPEGEAYKEESWGWLLDERWRGRVATVNEPTIGLFDLALAAQSKGLMAFKDIGNMTVSEIDQLFEILIDLKRDGHFAGVWNSVPESVSFMESGRVVIESMFSPGASALRARGVPVRYAAPKEGYRAWHGVMCLSSSCSEQASEAAYAYMNWWLSGRPGAVMARQGYYISVPDPIRSYLTKDEWEYWYAGEPAKTAVRGTDGRVIANVGERRNGGSYTERFSNIAVWNTVMDHYEHSLTRWGEFLSTEAAG